MKITEHPATPHAKRGQYPIPKGWHRLRNGTLLRDGDRFRWVNGWGKVDVCADGNWACSPYCYIRRNKPAKLRKLLPMF